MIKNMFALKCPYCDNEFKPNDDSIELSYRHCGLDKIIDKSIFQLSCPNCHKNFESDHSVSYIDHTRKFGVYYFPNLELATKYIKDYFDVSCYKINKKNEYSGEIQSLRSDFIVFVYDMILLSAVFGYSFPFIYQYLVPILENCHRIIIGDKNKFMETISLFTFGMNDIVAEIYKIKITNKYDSKIKSVSFVFSDECYNCKTKLEFIDGTSKLEDIDDELCNKIKSEYSQYTDFNDIWVIDQETISNIISNTPFTPKHIEIIKQHIEQKKEEKFMIIVNRTNEGNFKHINRLKRYLNALIKTRYSYHGSNNPCVNGLPCTNAKELYGTIMELSKNYKAARNWYIFAGTYTSLTRWIILMKEQILPYEIPLFKKIMETCALTTKEQNTLNNYINTYFD